MVPGYYFLANQAQNTDALARFDSEGALWLSDVHGTAITP